MRVQRLGLIVLLLLAAAPADAFRPRVPVAQPPQVDVAGELAAAIRARDAGRVAGLLRDPVSIYGLWFADPACAKQFGAPRVVRGAERAALARCLARLELQATTRQIAGSDRGLLTHAPGIELELGHRGGRVAWLGFEAQTRLDAGRPTLTAQALEALRVAGSPNLDAAVGERLQPILERSRAPFVSSWIKLCLDEAGQVVQVGQRTNSAVDAHAKAVEDAFGAAVRAWRFRPFLVRGKPVPACSMTLLTYPAGRAPLVETLPATPPPDFVLPAAAAAAADGGEDERDDAGDKPPFARLTISSGGPSSAGGTAGIFQQGSGVGALGAVGAVGAVGATPGPTLAPAAFAQLRLTGDPSLAPEPATARQMARAGLRRAAGTFRVCIDAQGVIMAVQVQRSTGSADFDRELVRAIHRWRFKPYTVGGNPAAVCGAVVTSATVPTKP